MLGQTITSFKKTFERRGVQTVDLDLHDQPGIHIVHVRDAHQKRVVKVMVE